MTGNLNLGGLSSINWGSFSPIKSQYSIYATGPWHDVQQSNDEYRRDSNDGGITWGIPYKNVAKDGRDGSDASIPSYIKSTYIDGTMVESPVIRGGKIAGASFTDLNEKSKLVLNPSNFSSGNADLSLYSGNNIALNIYDEITGTIKWSSYNNYFMSTGQYGTYAYGDWDFSNANVNGIKVVGVFG